MRTVPVFLMRASAPDTTAGSLVSGCALRRSQVSGAITATTPAQSSVLSPGHDKAAHDEADHGMAQTYFAGTAAGIGCSSVAPSSIPGCSGRRVPSDFAITAAAIELPITFV